MLSKRPKDMRRHRVDSTAVNSVGYDPATRTLEIEFAEGRIYQYFGVPRDEYQALLTSDSIGTYVNTILKPKHLDCREVGL